MNSLKIMFRTVTVILVGITLIALWGYALYHELPYLVLMIGSTGSIAILYRGYLEAKLIQKREIKREIRSRKYGQEN